MDFIFFIRLHYNDSGGIMRLHNSYRHDLKIYASDEGRCLKTAAAFCKGFLNLGNISQIIFEVEKKFFKIKNKLF